MHTEQRYHIYTSDNLTILRTLPDNSVDAVVTDPPAGIGFMGKEWDKDKGGRDKWIAWMSEVAAECLRVIKPGGHALVWALPRTSHWTATAWENAGWEPRDRICHIFGSGFPKSANISKQIDRMAGAEREVIGKTKRDAGSNNSHPFTSSRPVEYDLTAPATDAAKQWDGYGTALKPAVEDYWLFRKPIEKGLNIAQNVLKWGTGGLNIDGCRIATSDVPKVRDNKKTDEYFSGKKPIPQIPFANGGRFPANLIHDGSDEVVSLFPVTTSGNLKGQPRVENKIYGSASATLGKPMYWNGDTGSAARFFYCAKASRSEREAGLEGLEARNNMRVNAPRENEEAKHNNQLANHHPTVKPIALMRYLCRLVTPPGGIVLDPFTGSGTTGCAAMIEGFRFIGMEREAEYAEIARLRVEHWRDVVNQDETIIDDVQEKLFTEMV